MSAVIVMPFDIASSSSIVGRNATLQGPIGYNKLNVIEVPSTK